MLRPRIIPSLLVHNGGLVKSINFRDYKYVGDPLNAVRIFNDMGADELVIFDIDATSRRREIDYRFIERIARECRMPLCYGGGIASVSDAKRVIELGVEKVSISSGAIDRPGLVSELSSVLGRQSVVCTLDVKTAGFLKKSYIITTRNGTYQQRMSLSEFVRHLQDSGVGEIVFNSVDQDGKMTGYDWALVEYVKAFRRVPFSFLGGAGSYADFSRLARTLPFVGCSAGSLFVLNGKFRSVLISYPSATVKSSIFSGI